MKYNTIITTLLSSVMISAISIVNAAGTMDQNFKAMDMDGDGSITQEEALKDYDLHNRFKDLDTDGNGKPDNAEFSRFEKDMSRSPGQPPHSMDSSGHMNEGQGVEADDDDHTGTNSTGGFGRTDN